MNPYKRAEIVALWKQASFLAYRSWRVKNRVSDFLPSKAIVTVTIPFDDNRTRDPHNYCGTVLKAVVDGLVKAKAFPDDTYEFAGHREPILVVSPEKPSIHIELEEA